MAHIRFGVCEQRLGLLEILQMKQEPLFGEIECVGLSSYARSRQETLGLSESTLTKLRRFEEQTRCCLFCRMRSPYQRGEHPYFQRAGRAAAAVKKSIDRRLHRTHSAYAHIDYYFDLGDQSGYS